MTLFGRRACSNPRGEIWRGPSPVRSSAGLAGATLLGEASEGAVEAPSD
jgi:hypothetical protein